METPTTNGSNTLISAKQLKTSDASCLLTLRAALLELGGWEPGGAWCFWGAAGSRMDAVLRAPPRHTVNASYSQVRFIYPVHKDLIDSSLESTRTLSHSEVRQINYKSEAPSRISDAP